MKSQSENREKEAPIQVVGLSHKAALIAARAHEGGRSSTLAGPYIAHPMRVALYVSQWFGCQDDDVVAAALLHDVVEKTTVGLREVEIEFGESVATWVELLTRPGSMTKEIYYARLSSADWQARLVKLADVVDHLDCPHHELPSRIKSADRALALATTDEPSIMAARGWLESAIARGRRLL